jgi:hypothetical protein
MQAPPPVPALLIQLVILATNVENALTGQVVDWLWRPAADDWSLTEIVCHLRDVEREVHQLRFRALIAADNVFLSGVSADEWAEERSYQQQDGPAALTAFLSARAETVAMLTPLAEAMWQRQGRHAFFGTTTMHELLHLMARHDEIHWQQIKTCLQQQAAVK